jgi:hypothetical protein
MRDQRERPVFGICVANDGCDDLSAGMLYRVLPDDASAREGLLRVIDDSGEDYLYPSHRFVIVEVPEADEQRLLAVAAAPDA